MDFCLCIIKFHGQSSLVTHIFDLEVTDDKVCLLYGIDESDIDVGVLL